MLQRGVPAKVRTDDTSGACSRFRLLRERRLVQLTPKRRELMTTTKNLELSGSHGRLFVRRWCVPNPSRVVVIAHGIGEHSGRYEHVARRFADDGATVYAPDHAGHGRSGGEFGHIDDIEDLAEDLGLVIDLAREENPDLPLALVAHSLGGLITTRYLQRNGTDGLAALVLSGPFYGNPGYEALLGMDPLPEVEIDTAILSRDPAVGEAYAADELVYHGPGDRETLQAVFDAVPAVKSGPELGEVPICWVQGELDALAPLDVTKAEVERLHGPDFEAHVYTGAMHEVFNETNKDEVLDDVSAFVLART
jgi:alpha-beta hydrolase superfamily lysophospholipase